MEDIAVNCSCADVSLEHDALLTLHLPPELRTQILESFGHTYLDSLALAARVPRCTDRLFTLYKPVFVELVARWPSATTATVDDDIITLSCLARLLPFASHLRSIATQTLARINLSDLRQTPSSTAPLSSLPESQLITLLLALFRLISYHRDHFHNIIEPNSLSTLFNHDSLPVRYLAIVTMCQILHFADAYEMQLVQKYIGRSLILGKWEDTDIDFRLLKLWEEKRWKDLEAVVEDKSRLRSEQQTSLITRISDSDVSSSVAIVGGALLPRLGPIPTSTGSFQLTPKARTSLKKLGENLSMKSPILIDGPTGCGKTSLILEAARLLNKLDSLITLHLNEQTDAKSLVGIYTSSADGHGFTWQPGVLTKAIEEGRWILVEDIDRAPAEVLGVLKPVIENQALFIPSRKQMIRANDGFRLFATLRSSLTGVRFSLPSKHSWLANERFWNVVHLSPYDFEDIAVLISKMCPGLQPLLDVILSAYSSVETLFRGDLGFRAVQSRPPSLRDLLKWCRRVESRIHMHGLTLQIRALPETFQIDMFKDALDCFGSHLNDSFLYHKVAASFAQAMNLAPQQVQHHLRESCDVVVGSKQELRIGRSLLPKIHTRSRGAPQLPFASTLSTKRTLESISASVAFSEPYLLVGETGVGKTSAVQYIADLVGQKLAVINLSQQSEAADLLGGLKPITTRSIVLPYVEQFNELFDDTFPTDNESYKTALSKTLAKQNWPRLLKMWREALKLANQSLSRHPKPENIKGSGPPTKRRKVDGSRYAHLREKWSEFSSSLDQIQPRVENGDKAHAFSFVEGRLVQAVRNGDWLLLDEINLATSDTIDHIASLLQEVGQNRPYVLLTDAGEVEKIEAHPDFRVFAAMNPATDTGKKDLAPNIRSRFTELYVQAGDTEIDDLIKIIQAYLGSILTNDKRAAIDLAKAYLEVQRFNGNHKLTDGAGEMPHFSIRSLVRCLFYVVQNHASHGLRRSMYEGFAMGFFTTLSRESESLVSIAVMTSLLSNVKNVQSFLSQQPKMSTEDGEYMTFRNQLILKGPMIPDFQAHYIRTPSVERNLVNLARAASMRRFPILLQGPTSSGKTSMVEYLAKLSGHAFVRINNHEHTDLQEYLGSYASGSDGRLQFKDGVLVSALRHGHWLVLDELNLAPSDVLEALNRLLDDNRELLIPETQEILRPHPNFMLFATQNPAGLYGGRKRLSRAFRNRFLEIHFDDIPEDELEVILRERSRIAPSFCTQIVAVYKKLALQRQSSRLFEQRNSFATLRDLFRWASRHVDDRQQLACQGFMLLGERVRDSAERQIVKATIEETLKIKIDESVLYSLGRVPGEVQMLDGIVWTSAMRRLYVLVSEALRSREPVLLVGETGCGKTQICQVVSQAFGRSLNVYNAHTSTETGDLIGSQRPVRSRSQLLKDILDSFQAAGVSFANVPRPPDGSIEHLVAQFNEMDTTNLDADVVGRVRASIDAYHSLFVWNDGSLIRSMKAGEHFLLDEISLADDSVLERLNSVLETSRTILLAEKGSVDNLVVAQPDFQFLATMNPGGDYGKRELSPALRNRMTEIWVPALSQEDDVLPILRARLGEEHANFASSMLQFAKWFGRSFRNSLDSISLRDLLAWCNFIHSAKGLHREAAFVQGASLVYIDSLGASPAGMTTSHTMDVKEARHMGLKYLQRLASVDVEAIYNTVPELRISEDSIVLGPFSLPRDPGHALLMPELVFDAPTTLKNTLRIVRGLHMDRPILLEGSPGVGKTAIITALATMVGKRFTRINLSDQTDLMDLFGADTPAESESLGIFSWKDGPLLKAMQEGGWVLLDEMNLASQSVLEGLNSCLDHRKEAYIAELDKTFSCHPNFRLFAAQNPQHQGGGRKGLPASFVNRFTVVYADPLTEEDLQAICRSQNPGMSSDNILSVIHSVSMVDHQVARNSVFREGGPWELNLRDVSRWVEVSKSYPTVDPLYHYNTILLHRFRNPQQIQRIHDLLRPEGSSTISESMYNRLTPNGLQVGLSTLIRNPVMQPVAAGRHIPIQLLSQAKSVITAVSHSWPVILAGSSGSGKTQLVRSLAATAGVRLVEISMNSDIDTMDLLGGFEQYDERRELQTLMREILPTVIVQIERGLSISARQEVDELFKLHQTCRNPESTIEEVRQSLYNASGQLPDSHSFIQQANLILRQRPFSGARFVWNDGVLVDALEKGAWVVLDNANLCNASVLDRLNSLLEPNGRLIISEAHNDDSGTKSIKPHPDFRIFLTMDPMYGELSRAMRNRSLEVFLEAGKKESKLTQALTYPFASSIARLRNVFEMHQPASGSERFVDNLSIQEWVILQSQPQGSSPAEFEYRSAIDPAVWGDISELLANRFHESDQEDTSGARTHGPQQPLLDEPMVLRGIDTREKAQITAVAVAWDILVVLSRLRNDLKGAADRALTMSIKDLNILDRSALLVSRRKLEAKEPDPPQVWAFLTNMVEILLDFARSCLTSNSSILQIHGALPIAQYLRDFMRLFKVSSFDRARFQAFLTTGLDLCDRLAIGNHPLSQTLYTALCHFQTFRLKYGQSLQRMWQTWSSISVSNTSDLRMKLLLERMVDDFNFLSTRLPQSRQELLSIKSLLIRASVSGWKQPSFGTIVDEITKSLKTLATQSERRKSIPDHYRTTFESIARKANFIRSAIGDEPKMQALIMFCGNDALAAGCPTSSLTTEALQKLANIAGHLDCFSKAMAQDIVKDTAIAQDRQLRALDRLTEELDVLASVICSQTSLITSNLQPSIREYTQILLASILECHRDIICRNDQEKKPDLIRVLLQGPPLKALGDHQYFVPIVGTHLMPAAALLTQELKPDEDETDDNARTCMTGAALIHTCVAALMLIVPDRPFDVALYPKVVQERYHAAKMELLDKIEAQRKFNRKLMGQESSLLLRIYENLLEDLDEEPSAPAVPRPDISELDKVHEGFVNVIRSVIEMIPTSFLSMRMAACEQFLRDWPQVNISIERNLSKLADINRTYDDMVVPVKQLLKCLQLGAELIRLGSIPQCGVGDVISALDHTILVGSTPSNVLFWAAKNLSSESSKLGWLINHFLYRRIVWVSKERHYGHSGYLSVTDSLYHNWKSKLVSDQVEVETKSRYYAYRDDDQEGGLEARELAEMFPEYDDQDTDLVNLEDETQNSQQLASQLATIHQQLFSQGVSAEELQQHMIDVFMSMKTSVTSLEQILPAVMLQLQREACSLKSSEAPQTLDVYIDSSIEETRKLFHLAHRIQNRFFEISDRWPEHFVPLDVISFADEMLDLKLNSPLVKLLTKAEKLLEIVAQWQSVASQEWSAASWMEELTALIISWRRMELSSWSRLLDLEKHKNDEKAKKWYFVAYEAVLYNSRRVVEDGDDVKLYCEGLAKTLEDFLRLTSLGQFSPRLRLLETLSNSLAEIAFADRRLIPILSSVRNTTCHFSRYEADIQKTLQSGRVEIEQAVIEQIKLASWKDTNITALRDSARRSHYKLFKIVKKYRKLLERPVTVLKAQDFDVSLPSSATSLALGAVSVPNNDIQAAIQGCAESIRGWQSRPARLKDPSNAVVTMRQVYSNCHQDLEIDDELESHRVDLASLITTLRKETPATLTDENSAVVKHLRERKRKLLTDTIKSIAHMGVRRNLATSELEKQASTAVVLASTPDLEEASDHLQAANEAFHALLDTVPQVRAALAQHSPELTDGEVRRGAGLLEGLLSISIKQRQQCSSASIQLRGLDESMKMLRTVCNQSSDLLIGNPAAGQAHLEERLPWIAMILDISCNILDFQAERGDLDLGALIEALRSAANFARDERTKLVDLKQSQILPNALSTRSAAVWQAGVWQRLHQYGDDMKDWCLKEPNVAYLLTQIIPWTEQPQDTDEQMVRSELLIAADIDELARNAADSVFVALQNLSHVKTKAPTSFEDVGWLVQSDKFLQESMQALHVATVSNAVKEVLDRIQHLQIEELSLTVQLLKVMAPILEQFYLICEHLQQKQVAIHVETSRFACLLAKSFATVATEGFCSPAEPNNAQDQSGKLESGTGLGEGEGAEDISKDVGADEDMSEFAQSGEKREEEGETSDVEDAVDMGAEDLEGEMGEGGKPKEAGEGDSGDEMESADEMDEETGSVDDLDPTAVDEKMWDEAAKDAKEQEKDLKSEKQKGQKGDDQTERQDGKAAGKDQAEVEQGEANDEEIEDDDVGEGKAEAENADPHLQDEKALELPEEIQLNGEQSEADDDISNDAMEELSDVEQPEGKSEDFDGVSEADAQEEKPFEGGDEPEGEEDDNDNKGWGQEDEVLEDQIDSQESEKDHTERDGDLGQDIDEQAGGEAGNANQHQDDIDEGQDEGGENEIPQAENDQKPQSSKAANEKEQGQSGKGVIERGSGRDDKAQRSQDEALRRLADVLEQWHQRRDILNPQEDRQEGQLDDDIDMAEADFEHVENEDKGDTQALGAAGADQAQNLDPKKAIQDEDMPVEDNMPMPDAHEQAPEDVVNDRLSRLQASSATEHMEDGSYVPNQNSHPRIFNAQLNHDSEADVDETTASVRDLDIAADRPPMSPPTSSTSANELWTYCSSQVHAFSFILTEQLRLILSPTTATKLRGDFRTGKRLNIKRIIPYIASGYKRDKIWMRRSVPSKRNYQVLLAVDDSKSMSESGADLLALQTTALLCKSLSMLEVGDIAVIGFGDEANVAVAHDFGTPWTNGSGVEVFRHFGFQQKGTNVQNMVQQSLDMLREARLKSTASNASELWQLQLIISDGHCGDHEGIRRLVRQAKEERVVMVFVIVDNALPAEEGKAVESILDLKEAVFEPDTREGKEGEMRVMTRRYLERFPFDYYLVVKDVRDLPGVLSRCLKGWMGSVVET